MVRATWPMFSSPLFDNSGEPVDKFRIPRRKSYISTEKKTEQLCTFVEFFFDNCVGYLKLRYIAEKMTFI